MEHKVTAFEDLIAAWWRLATILVTWPRTSSSIPHCDNFPQWRRVQDKIMKKSIST